MQGSIFSIYTLKIRTNSVTLITNHEAAFITVCAPEKYSPVVVVITPPTSLTHRTGIHPVTSTLAAGTAHHLRVLERSQYLPELACLVELFDRVSILQTNY